MEDYKQLNDFLKYLGRGGNYQYFIELPIVSKDRYKCFTVGTDVQHPLWKSAYFSVNPVYEEPKKKKATNADVMAINTFFADMDGKDFSGGDYNSEEWAQQPENIRDEANKKSLEYIESLTPPPSVIVFSGGGYQVYWLIKDPQILTDENRGRLSSLQAGWVEYVKGDNGAKDLSRVFRVPGSYNNKYEPAKKTEFVKYDLNITYTVDEIRGYLEELPDFLRNSEEKTIQKKSNGNNGNSRNNRHINIAHKTVDIAGLMQQLSKERVDKYTDWISVGQILHHELDDAGLIFWEDWSKKSKKYIDGQCKIKWQTFGKTNTDNLTIATLQKYVNEDKERGKPFQKEESASGDLQTPENKIDDIATDIIPELIPELPKSFLDKIGTGDEAGKWLDEYVKYAEAVSPMTPRHFHESAGLWLVSVAIARRLVLKMPFDDIFPNLYILWDAPSTLYKKSTAMKIVWKIASETFPQLLAQNDSTPEALLSDMAGKKPTNYDDMTFQERTAWEKERDYKAQRGQLIDEISGLFATMQRDYSAGLREIYLKLHDCVPSITRSTKGQGRIEVKDSYLSILGASTPSALAQYLRTENMWASGFFPRFAILTVGEEKPKWIESRDVDYPASISKKLEKIFSELPAATDLSFPDPLTVGFGKGVMNIWREYNKIVTYDILDEVDPTLHAAYGRLPTHVLKVATILATLDWEMGRTPIIEKQHLARAIQIVEDWRKSAHAAIAYSIPNDVEQTWIRIETIIATKNNGIGISKRDIKKLMRNIKGREIDETMATMLEAGVIENYIKKASSKGGRTTELYRTT